MLRVGTELYADCMLVVGEEEVRIPAHRALLHNNEWFRTVFQSKMVESQEVDSKTGKSPDILFPAENPQTFTLFLEHVYGQLAEIGHTITIEHFGELAAISQRYMDEELAMKCEEFLRRQYNHNDFWDYLFEFREKTDGRQISRKVYDQITHHFGIAEDFPLDKEKEPTTVENFISNCTADDLNAIVKGALHRDQPCDGTMKFVQDIMIPALQRITGKTSMAEISHVLLTDDAFVMKKQWTFTLSRKCIDSLLNLTAGPCNFINKNVFKFGEAIGFYMTQPKECKYYSISSEDKDAHMLFTAQSRPLVSTRELLRLSDNSKENEEDEESPLLTLCNTSRIYNCLYLLHCYMINNACLAGVTFVGMPLLFFRLIGQNLYTKLMDDYVSATDLIEKILPHLETAPANQESSVFFCGLFKHYPWVFVHMDVMLQVMKLDASITGMDQTDWGEIIVECNAIQAGEIATPLHLNYSLNGGTTLLYNDADFVSETMKALQEPKPLNKRSLSDSDIGHRKKRARVDV